MFGPHSDLPRGEVLYDPIPCVLSDPGCDGVTEPVVVSGVWNTRTGSLGGAVGRLGRPGLDRSFYEVLELASGFTKMEGPHPVLTVFPYSRMMSPLRVWLLQIVWSDGKDGEGSLPWVTRRPDVGWFSSSIPPQPLL